MKFLHPSNAATFSLSMFSRHAFTICLLRAHVVLVASTLMCVGCSHLQPSSPPPPLTGSVQASVVPDGVIRRIDDGEDFSCADLGKVLVGRRRDFDNRTTSYECATVTHGGLPVRVERQRKAPRFEEGRGSYYSGSDRIMTAAETFSQFGPFPDVETIHGSSVLVSAKEELLNVRPNAQSSTAPIDRFFRCPANTAMWARFSPIVYFCATIWSGNPPTSTPSGMVIFRHAETKMPCAISAPNGPMGEELTYMFIEHFSTCEPSVAESVEFEGMPSAARVILTSDPYCHIGNGNTFWIELRTISKSVTFSAINLDDIFTFPKGAIIEPGLKLVDYYRRSTDPAVQRLNCVRITTSSAPPASP